MTYNEIVKQSNDFVDGMAYDQHQGCNLKRLVVGKKEESTKFKKGEEFDVFTVSGTRSQHGFVAFPIRVTSVFSSKNILQWDGYLPYWYDSSSNTMMFACPETGKMKVVFRDGLRLPCSIVICDYDSTENPRIQIVKKCKVECDSSDHISIPIGDGPVELVAYFEETELRPYDIYRSTNGKWKYYSGKTIKYGPPAVLVRGLTEDQLKTIKFKYEILQ